MVENDNAAPFAGYRTREEAEALFDGLPAVRAEEITTGRWRGYEVDTGHPMGGTLSASGWYGKQFDDVNTVHPLLFASGSKIFPIDPRRVPLGLADRIPLGALRAVRRGLPVFGPALRTRKPTARLRDIEFRGATSAAMVYDHLPIIDHFRRADERTLLGLMDLRGMSQPYFFALRRDDA
ncbi:DUF4334 domain-containing protein [Nocardia callitridis]|uniref:DUF4334 domain-containing protein n=1 Tax=Nocardia callitridis TaxID=648753 RepID=A0ABP9K957_9NOCA